jgi:hypothetical protein
VRLGTGSAVRPWARFSIVAVFNFQKKYHVTVDAPDEHKSSLDADFHTGGCAVYLVIILSSIFLGVIEVNLF